MCLRAGGTHRSAIVTIGMPLDVPGRMFTVELNIDPGWPDQVTTRRRRAFRVASSVRRFTWAVFRPHTPGAIGRGRSRHADLTDRIGHSVALRCQVIDLAQLRDDRFALVSLPRHEGPPAWLSTTSGWTASGRVDQKSTAATGFMTGLPSSAWEPVTAKCAPTHSNMNAAHASMAIAIAIATLNSTARRSRFPGMIATDLKVVWEVPP